MQPQQSEQGPSHRHTEAATAPAAARSAFTARQWLGRTILSAGVSLLALLLSGLAGSASSGPHPWPRWIAIAAFLLAALFALFIATALASWRAARGVSETNR